MPASHKKHLRYSTGTIALVFGVYLCAILVALGLIAYIARQNRASTVPLALEPTATSHQWPTVSPTYTYPPMSLEERTITDLVNNSPPDSLPPTMICNSTVELYLYTLWEYLKSACGEDQFVVTYPPKQVWGYNEGVIAMELRYDNTYLLFLKLTNEDSFRLYNYYTK